MCEHNAVYGFIFMAVIAVVEAFYIDFVLKRANSRVAVGKAYVRYLELRLVALTAKLKEEKRK